MKKKLFNVSVLAIAALLGMGVVGCGGGTSSSGTPSSVTPSSVTPSSSVAPSSEVKSSPVPSSSIIPPSSSKAEKKVTQINVSLSVEGPLYVGDTAVLAVEVLPADAADKRYDIAVEDSEVITVVDGEVTALKAGSSKITATAKDGSGVSGEVEVVVEDIPDPTITLSSEDPITVAAGAEVALPVATARDYDGTDLTDDLEIEDAFESGTLKDGKFLSKIAGVHTISYYVETEDERSASKSIEITVTPATAETFDVTGYQDPSSVSTYGVFKENFENPKANPIGAHSDNGAISYSATSEAISGNSMIIDANKTAGSAANQVFLNAFNDYFLRGTSVTYKMEFEYKILTSNANMGDFYASIFWDGSSGLNVNGFNQDGEQHHMECTWTATKIPSGGNAWFSFWKLGLSGDEAVIAIDNIVITAIEAKEVTTFVPTTDELHAGVTWDMEEKATTSSNGEVMDVAKIKDATAKAAIEANEDYSDSVLHLINADGHLLACLTGDNLEENYVLDMEIYYYAVNDGGFHVIMMGSSGNPTLTVQNEDLGEGFHKVTFSHLIKSGQYQINVYGASNPSFDIYIGKLVAKTTQNTKPQGQITNPTDYHKVTNAELCAKGGYTWDLSKENYTSWGSNDYFDIDEMGGDFQAAKEAMQASENFGDYAIRTYGGKFKGIQSDALEVGKVLTVEFDYYPTSTHQQWGYIIMMGKNDNNKPEYTGFKDGYGFVVTDLGNGLKHFKLTTLITQNNCDDDREDGCFTTYNGAPDMFVGKITASLTLPKDVTTKDLEAGVTWDMVSREESFNSVTGKELSELVGAEAAAKLEGLGYSYGILAHTDSADSNAAFSGVTSANAVAGYKIEGKIVYFVEAGKTAPNYRLLGGSDSGWSAPISQEIKGEDGTTVLGTLYVAEFADVNCPKSPIALWHSGSGFDAVVLEVYAKLTALEEKLMVKQYINFYGSDGGESAAHTWTSAERSFTMDGSSNDATLWFAINENELLDGEKYVARLTMDFADGFEGNKICLRQGNSLFQDFEFDPQPGTHTYEIPFTSNGSGFIGLYFLQCTGTVTVSSVLFAENDAAVQYADMIVDQETCSVDKATRMVSIGDSAHDSTVWFTTSATPFIKDDVPYIVTFEVEYGEDFESEVVSLRLGNSFQNIDYNPNGRKLYQVTLWESAASQFLGLYVCKGKGSYRLSIVSVRESSEADVWYGFYGLDGGATTGVKEWNGTNHELMLNLDAGADATVWASTNCGLTAGQTYIARFSIEYYTGYINSKPDEGSLLAVREGNALFEHTDKGMVEGRKDYVVPFVATGDGCFGLYFKNAVGTCKISVISVEAVEYGVNYMNMQCDGGDTPAHETTNRQRRIDLNVPTGDASIWFRTAAPSPAYEDDAIYEVRFDLLATAGAVCGRVHLRCNNVFVLVDSNLEEGWHTYSVYVTGAQLMNGDCLGLYFNNNVVGTFFCTAMSVILVG